MRGRSWALGRLLGGARRLLGGSWGRRCAVRGRSWAPGRLLDGARRLLGGSGTLEVSKFWVMVPVLLVSGKFGHN